MIDVVDVNDHRPMFSQAVYHVDVSEMTSVGTTLLVLPATDNDITSSLVYSILHTEHVTSARMFTLQPVTGHLILIQPLDRLVLTLL